jgi:hypothetical protein
LSDETAQDAHQGGKRRPTGWEIRETGARLFRRGATVHREADPAAGWDHWGR